MAVTIHIIEKKNNSMGNPVYKVLIPGETGKIKGLRKLKAPQQYSFSSYNIKDYLKNYSFKGEDVIIFDKYGDRL